MYNAVAKRKAEGRRLKAEWWLFFSLLISAFSLLTGCQSVAPVAKVALVAPFEGAQRAVGYDVIYSARLAVREINEAGGIGGYRVSLVALDDGGDPELARQLLGLPGAAAPQTAVKMEVTAVATALTNLTHNGLTGTIFQPNPNTP